MIDVDAAADYVVLGDCATVLPTLPDASVQLIYIDPPFNTGKAQRGARSAPSAMRTATAPASRAGATPPPSWAGTPTTTCMRTTSACSSRSSSRRGACSTASGTLYLHIDYREAHYVKLLLDDVFGRDAFLNELIWAYDFGGRARDRWPAKHDTILVYVRTPGGHFFDQDAVERIPYLAPGLVGPEKAARGKLPTDVWWHTIVPTAGSGEDRLSQPEARGHPAPDRVGVEPPRRPGPRLLRRQRHHRRRRRGAGPPLRARRPQPGSDRGHAATATGRDRVLSRVTRSSRADRGGRRGSPARRPAPPRPSARTAGRGRPRSGTCRRTGATSSRASGRS